MRLGTTNRIKDLTIEYPFDIVNSPNLVKYLFLVHERKGLKPQRDFRAYLREMKKLLDEVGEERAKFLILKASETCSYPFSTEYLRKLNNVLTEEK